MQYLWIVVIIIVYLITWGIFVSNVIEEIRDCKLSSKKPKITDFIAEILSDDYVKSFLIIHAAVLFIVSFCMFVLQGGE